MLKLKDTQFNIHLQLKQFLKQFQKILLVVFVLTLHARLGLNSKIIFKFIKFIDSYLKNILDFFSC